MQKATRRRANSNGCSSSWKRSPIWQYYQKIKLGNIVAGKLIIDWYDLVVRQLEAGTWVYNAARYKRVAVFVETFAHHSKGAKAPGLLKLELWQKAFLAVVFGIVDKETGNRQFREAVLVVGRKNGKSLFISAIAEYMAVFDGEKGAEIYFCATKLKQASICYEAFLRMVDAEPEIREIARKRRTDVYFPDSNTTVEPLAFAHKTSDGFNPHLGVCDEMAAWAGDRGLKLYEVLKSGQGARTQPLIISTTTANYQTGGIYDELMKRATAVIKGTSRETRLAPFLYVVDDVEKWDDLTELKKANPNLGISVPESYLRDEINIARESLTRRNEFITKYCNVQQNSSAAWLSAQTIKKAFGWNYTLEDFRDTYALGGIDLSQTTDLTSACVLIEREGVIWVFAHFWMPAEGVNEATERDGVPYRIMAERGLLTLSGDTFVDYHDCERWFLQLVQDYKIFPLMTGYDRYSAQYLVQDLQSAGFHMESVFQGFNLTGIEDTFEGMLKNGTLRCADDNDLLKLHMMDAAQTIETNTSAHPRKKLVKLTKNGHVDGVAAILDALCMRANHWAEFGERLKNES